MKNMTVTQWCHLFLEKQVKPGDLCIDATAGNGYDTIFLAELVGPSGHVIAFDIQQAAIDSSRLHLEEKQLSDRVELIHASHAAMSLYASEDSVSCIVFNLGYLPGGDHSIATQAATTLQAINASLSLLAPNGLLALCVYRGKDTGSEEHTQVLTYLKNLDPKKYLVILTSYYNRPNTPPDMILVIKL